MNDTFHEIGEKMAIMLTSHHAKNAGRKEYTTMMITMKDYENATIPYFSEKIVLLNPTRAKQFALANKTVIQAVEETITFCFALAYKFEYKYRDFSELWRKESMHDKINKLDKLGEKLEKLLMGENVEV